MKVTIWVCGFKQIEHVGTFYMIYEVVLPNLNENIENILKNYPYSTSPSSLAIALTPSRCSSVNSTPYSSHIAIYSWIDIVPSPPVSALSNSSQRAEKKIEKMKLKLFSVVKITS
jgi:hypothetical protein